MSVLERKNSQLPVKITNHLKKFSKIYFYHVKNVNVSINEDTTLKYTHASFSMQNCRHRQNSSENRVVFAKNKPRF